MDLVRPGQTSQGCLWYTEEQADELLDQLQENSPVIQTWDVVESSSGDGEAGREASFDQALQAKRRVKRKLTDMQAAPHKKWSNPIFYKFDGNHG